MRRPFPLAAFLVALVATAAVCRAASGDAPDAPGPRVVRPPDAGAPLADRWAWARSEARRAEGPVWIGWAVRRDEAGLFMSSAGPHRGDDRRETAALLGEPADRRAVALLFGIRDGTVVATRIRSLGSPIDVTEGTVFWLGTGASDESLALVEAVYAGSVAAGPAVERGPMIALHPARLAVPALRAILFGDAPVAVRAEAAAWLGHHVDEPEGLALLVDLLASAPPWPVLDEAIAAARESRAPAIRAALLALLAGHPDAGARAGVAEALGEAGADAGVRAALVRATADPSPAVRSEARDALEEIDEELHGDRDDDEDDEADEGDAG